MSDLTDAPHEDDEAKADAEVDDFCDALMNLAIAAPGPIRVAVLQMAGLLPPAGSPISQELLALTMGIGRKRIRKLEARFLATLKRQLSPNANNPTETQP
jgi:hypothetical protein